MGPKLAPLHAFAEQLADPLLVAAPLGHERRVALALEVAPFPHENGRDVELPGDDGQVGAQREADPLGRRRVGGDRVQCGVERVRAFPGDFPEQVLLGGDVVVERGFCTPSSSARSASDVPW